MKSLYLPLLLLASLGLWGVDLRVRRGIVLRSQAQQERELRRLEEELRRLRGDVQEALATPQLQFVFEEMGYHRSFRETRSYARALLKNDAGTRLAAEQNPSRPEEGPLW